MANTSNSLSMEQFIQIPRIFLATIGIPTKKINGIRQFTMNFFFYLHFFNLGACVLGEMIFLVMSLANNQGDFINSTFLILCIGFIMISFAKVITFRVKKELLNELIEELYQYHPNSAKEQDDYAVIKYLQRAQTIMRWYAMVQMVMIWCFNLFPLTDTIIDYVRDRRWTMEFSYLIWYPIDPYKRGYFEAFYASQFWAAHVSATGILAVDILLCGIVISLCMHFDQLSHALLMLTPSEQYTSRERYLLAQYVKKHNIIISWSKKLDNIFAVTTLFNFISSSVVICVIGFLVIYSNEITEVLKFSFTLITCIVQIFLLGWLGDQLIAASTNIAFGAYNSEWYKGSAQYQRNLVFIIARSQRPQQLTAYKFAVASQITFSSVLSVSWRFLTLLNTMYSGK